MRRYVLRDEVTGAALGAVAKAESAWDRLVGLLASPRVPPHDGIWLEPCGAIHTLGMRCALDVIFLDRARRVVDVRENVAPNQMVVLCRNAHVTIELGAGSLRAGLVHVGDVLRLEETALPQ